MRYLVLLLATAFLFTGCGVPRLPERTGLAPSEVPSHDPSKARVFFYQGYLKISWNTDELDHSDGQLYLGDKLIGYMSPNDVVVVDLSPGVYKAEWVMYFTAQRDKDIHRKVPYELTVKAGDTVYLEANAKYVSSATADVLGVLGGAIGGAAGAAASHYANYFESQPQKGPNKIKWLKVVDYQDLSAPADSGNKSTPTAPTPSTSDNPSALESRLADLKQMYDRKLITKEEYDAKRKALLDEL